MRRLTILTIAVLLVAAAIPVAAQDKGGGLGGVLDTLGSVLGGARKIHGTVVLIDGSTLVLRGDDHRTYRVDTASLEPARRTALRPGQVVTVTARGGGQGGVLVASDLQPEASGAGTTYQTVSGTIQEASPQRVLFKTRDGLVLPIDVAQMSGLPYLGANQPATLYYEPGNNQQIVGVWLQPGASQPSASVPSTSSGAATTIDSLQGLVESIGISELRVQTSDGRTVSVDTQGVDRQTLGTVRPGDVVTITGRAGSGPDRFIAQSVQPRR
jgi:hypothetical protein